MTAMLSCDGCGEIVSDRPDDEDPTARWWALTAAPPVGGMGLLPMISMTTEYSDEPTEPVDIPPVEPDRHFCSVPCLVAWAGRRSAA